LDWLLTKGALLPRQVTDDLVEGRILIEELRDDLAQGRFPRRKVEALGLLGIRARPAVPFLLQFLSKHGDETGEISKALKRIELDDSNNMSNGKL
jgi:hypothetical protein